MSRSHLVEALRRHVLLADGGMGSRVQALSLDIERDFWGRENCTDVLVLSRPDIVREIHRGYFAAGADVVETNTFGASPVTLGEFDLADRSALTVWECELKDLDELERRLRAFLA